MTIKRAFFIKYSSGLLKNQTKYSRNLYFFGKKLNRLRGYLTTTNRSILMTESVVILANPNRAPKNPYKSHPCKNLFENYIPEFLKKIEITNIMLCYPIDQISIH